MDSSWSLPQVVEFFSRERNQTSDIYKSEREMLRGELREGLSVLDVGCAQGGFATIFACSLNRFSYTGVDISGEMIERARINHPQHRFIHANFAKDSIVDGTFDLTICLGVLHLTLDWREIIRRAWASTTSSFVFDLRETTNDTIEDRERSFFRMDWNGGGDGHRLERLPYIVINSVEALTAIEALCEGYKQIEQYGYFHEPRGSASLPYEKVITKCYKVTKGGGI